MKCLNCNNEIDESNNFCNYCGYKVNNINEYSNNIDDFKTLDGVTNLFRRVNCISTTNCFVVTFKNQNIHVSRTAVATGAFGVIGSTISGIAEDSERNSKEKIIRNNLGINNYDGLILNVMENGLGIIPLINQGSKFIMKLDNYIPNISNFVFVNNSDIESINLKKISMFSNKIWILTIKIKGGIVFDLTANMVEKQIPYQNENMTKFVNMYIKK